MQPREFWNCDFKRVTLYCASNTIKENENYKQSIILNEAVTNKIIQAHQLNRKSKIVPLTKVFRNFFEKK